MCVRAQVSVCPSCLCVFESKSNSEVGEWWRELVKLLPRNIGKRDKKEKKKGLGNRQDKCYIERIFLWSVIIGAFLAFEMLFLFFVKHSLLSYSF